MLVVEMRYEMDALRVVRVYIGIREDGAVKMEDDAIMAKYAFACWSAAAGRWRNSVITMLGLFVMHVHQCAEPMVARWPWHGVRQMPNVD